MPLTAVVSDGNDISLFRRSTIVWLDKIKNKVLACRIQKREWLHRCSTCNCIFVIPLSTGLLRVKLVSESYISLNNNQMSVWLMYDIVSLCNDIMDVLHFWCK